MDNGLERIARNYAIKYSDVKKANKYLVEIARKISKICHLEVREAHLETLDRIAREYRETGEDIEILKITAQTWRFTPGDYMYWKAGFGSLVAEFEHYKEAYGRLPNIDELRTWAKNLLIGFNPAAREPDYDYYGRDCSKKESWRERNKNKGKRIRRKRTNSDLFDR